MNSLVSFGRFIHVNRTSIKKEKTIDQHRSVDKQYVPMLKDKLITFWLKVKTIILCLKLD